jgi:hypothetical protein
MMAQTPTADINCGSGHAEISLMMYFISFKLSPHLPIYQLEYKLLEKVPLPLKNILSFLPAK